MRRRVSVSAVRRLSLRGLTLVSVLGVGIFAASSSAQTITAPSAGDGTAGNPYQISSLENLNWIANQVGAHSNFVGTYFVQTQDINASATWGAGYNGGQGFAPPVNFSGHYDGQSHVVDSLFIARTGNPSGQDMGLFGVVGSSAVIQNLGATNVHVTGYDFVAGLVADLSSGSVITNCYSTGTVSAVYGDAGGLVGENDGTVSTSYSTCTVLGGSNWSFGGLVGYNAGGTISDCYATGGATGSNAVGGLVGNNSSGTITNSYSLHPVASGSTNGGLVGAAFNGTISNSFWNTDSTTTGVGSDASTSNNSLGKTSAELKALSTFTNAGWDFVLETTNGTNDYWDQDTTSKVINNGYPFLSWQNGNVVVLPVEMVSFTVSAHSSNAELRWTTATEANTNGWEVERRTIANFGFPTADWKIVGSVKGAETSASPKQYSFLDQDLSTGTYMYRLKQIDRSGSFKYSQEVQVDIGTVPSTFTLSQNYPNPFNPSTTIGFTLEHDGRAVLKVYDILGREIATLLDENRAAGQYQQVVFDASRLSSGTYFAVLRSGGKQLFTKMILLK